MEALGCLAERNCTIGPCIVEDVLLVDFETRGLFVAWGAAFRHVRLEGRCGRIMLTNLPTGVHSPDKIAAFEKANEQYYSEPSIDWSLDIADAEFQEADIRSVPARLIRRDAETQVAVRRAQVEATRDIWLGLDLEGTPWVSSLQNMLRWGAPDKVLVAPKRRKDFKRWQAGLRALLDNGVAEL